MLKLLKLFVVDRQGATSIEYGLIAAMIAVAAVGAMQKIGSNLSNKFGNIGTNLR